MGELLFFSQTQKAISPPGLRPGPKRPSFPLQPSAGGGPSKKDACLLLSGIVPPLARFRDSFLLSPSLRCRPRAEVTIRCHGANAPTTKGSTTLISWESFPHFGTLVFGRGGVVISRWPPFHLERPTTRGWSLLLLLLLEGREKTRTHTMG